MRTGKPATRRGGSMCPLWPFLCHKLITTVRLWLVFASVTDNLVISVSRSGLWCVCAAFSSSFLCGLFQNTQKNSFVCCGWIGPRRYQRSRQSSWSNRVYLLSCSAVVPNETSPGAGLGETYSNPLDRSYYTPSSPRRGYVFSHPTGSPESERTRRADDVLVNID